MGIEHNEAQIAQKPGAGTVSLAEKDGLGGASLTEIQNFTRTNANDMTRLGFPGIEELSKLPFQADAQTMRVMNGNPQVQNFLANLQNGSFKQDDTAILSTKGVNSVPESRTPECEPGGHWGFGCEDNVIDTKPKPPVIDHLK